MRRRRKYSHEYRQEAIELAKRSGASETSRKPAVLCFFKSFKIERFKLK